MVELASICSLVCLTSRNTRILTQLIDLVRLTVMDVVSEKFLSQVKTFTAVRNTLSVLVNLEQKQNVVLINLTADLTVVKEIRYAYLYVVLLVG